jgi:pimeloyl-ACP methyl ester carboxylesterase
VTNPDILALTAHEIDVEGCPISYRLVGKGKPLLLIMGLGADVSAWQEHVAVYSRGFRCILVDNRGVGESGRPAGPYTTVQMAGDCAEVIRAVTDEPVSVMGLSMGGAIAQELALRYPSLVHSLVLVSTWARCDSYLSELFEHLRIVQAKLAPQEFAQLLQLRIWSPSYFASHHADLQAARQLAAALSVPPESFAAQCAACISHDSLSRLGNIDIPTLITAGCEDSFTALDHAQQIHRSIPASHLEIFAGAHAHHWEGLERFNDITVAWLEDRYASTRIGGDAGPFSKQTVG